MQIEELRKVTKNACFFKELNLVKKLARGKPQAVFKRKESIGQDAKNIKIDEKRGKRTLESKEKKFKDKRDKQAIIDQWGAWTSRAKGKQLELMMNVDALENRIRVKGN